MKMDLAMMLAQYSTQVRVRDALQGFVGQKIDPQMLARVEAAAQAAFDEMVAAGVYPPNAKSRVKYDPATQEFQVEYFVPTPMVMPKLSALWTTDFAYKGLGGADKPTEENKP